MEFCEICENVLSLKMEENELKYTCRACKKNYPPGENFNPCVYKNNYGGNEKIFYDMFVNKYTFNDPTLPRSREISCPECQKNKDKKKNPEVIYIEYDHDQMKYIYVCCDCKLAWIHPEYQQTESLYKLE